MENPKKYSIGEAARLCSVTAKQIRHWEEKNYIPKSTRIVCGERAYRYFGEADLEIIRRIKHYLDLGFTLPNSAEKAGKDCRKKGGGTYA